MLASRSPHKAARSLVLTGIPNPRKDTDEPQEDPRYEPDVGVVGRRRGDVGPRRGQLVVELLRDDDLPPRRRSRHVPDLDRERAPDARWGRPLARHERLASA